MNKDETQRLDVDSSKIKLVVETGIGTIDSTNPGKVFGLEDDDVTTKPNVVEELKDSTDTDTGQIWTVTEVEQKPTETNKFYTFSINNYFLTAGKKQLTVQGKKKKNNNNNFQILFLYIVGGGKEKRNLRITLINFLNSVILKVI